MSVFLLSDLRLFLEYRPASKLHFVRATLPASKLISASESENPRYFHFPDHFKHTFLKRVVPKNMVKTVVLKITCSRNSACSKIDMFELCIYFDVKFIKILEKSRMPKIGNKTSPKYKQELFWCSQADNVIF